MTPPPDTLTHKIVAYGLLIVTVASALAAILLV